MKKAFTLAEVLITLAIIGIVAALTIPTLVANYQKKQWVAGLQKAYATMNNVVKLAMANDGVDSFRQTTLWQAVPANESGARWLGLSENDHSAFIVELGKYMKIAKYDNPINDGFDICYKDFDGDDRDCSFNKSDRLRVFSTDNIIYYFRLNDEPLLNDNYADYKFENNYIYVGTIEVDVNGTKGPNQMGRDLFSFALVDDGRVILPGTKQWEANSHNNHHWSDNTPQNQNPCKNGQNPFAGEYCGARIFENGWKMDY